MEQFNKAIEMTGEEFVSIANGYHKVKLYQYCNNNDVFSFIYFRDGIQHVLLLLMQ